jgi:hypothetical protein
VLLRDVEPVMCLGLGTKKAPWNEGFVVTHPKFFILEIYRQLVSKHTKPLVENASTSRSSLIRGYPSC